MFDFRGTWKSTYMFADIVVHVVQNGGTVHGVAEVSSLLGGKNEYHFDGIVKGNAVSAWHYKGRRFEGKATGHDRVVGILTTCSGSRLRLWAKRISRD